MIIKYPFKKLIRCAIRLCMINEYLVVNMLDIIHEIETEYIGMTAPAIQPDPDIVPDQTAIQGECL